MTVAIEMGRTPQGQVATLDLEELLSTRLLVQGNSGSGKSHLLRRLLEQSAPWVQQAVIDPEGDFVTLAGKHGHLVIDAADHTEPQLARIGDRVRRHRVSVVLTLEGVEVEAQLRCAAAFLGGLFDADRDAWNPMMVVVDEAQLFAPAATAGETSDEARRAALGAMTNLMCRGRKRGLAGVIATQRLAKLAKNVAAEASNFMMGRTFLDIDMARAADLLGMERRQADGIRDLARGTFLALGPAVSRRPITVKIGAVATSARSGSPKLTPLPSAPVENLQELIFAPPPEEAPQLPMSFDPRPRRVPTDELLDTIERPAAPATLAPLPDKSDAEVEGIYASVLEAIVADRDSALRPPSVLFQDFQVRCRMAGLAKPPLDLPGFTRRLSAARAGIFDVTDPDWAEAMELANTLPDDMIGAFLLIARAARAGEPCPSDVALAETYGTSSLGRVRRLIGYIESRELIVARVDLSGKRSITIPRLGWTTAASEAA